MNAASKALIKKYCPEIFLRFYWFYRVAQFRLLRFVPRYDEDVLITAHKCDFVNDPHFKACYGTRSKRSRLTSLRKNIAFRYWRYRRARV